MANTIRVPRTHLIMALCLPLAVLIGYFLAEPAEVGGMAILGLVLTVLATPLAIRYHHPFLLMAWNASVGFLFLPGHPDLWMVLAFVSLLVSVFNRATDPDKRFLESPGSTRALLFLFAVVGATAVLTGGVGFRSFGSSHYGGRFYLEIGAAVAGYFALTSQRIPTERAGLIVGVFFLSALTAMIGNAIYMAGPSFYFLYEFFPSGGAMAQAMADASLWHETPRYGNFAPASIGVLCWLLARYGVRGTFDCSKPWRLGCFLLAMVACLLSGFRSGFVLFLVILACVFLLEGLWRTRALPLVMLAGLVSLAVLLPQSENLPAPIQRCLSFLPVKIDPAVAEDARYSTEWRLDIWRQLEPQIPKYLIKGKGYTFDAGDLARAETTANAMGSTEDISLVSMEYHSGPLSVLIPFGLFGMAGFLWFLIAGLRVVYYNFRYGEPALQRVNTLLFALFAVKSLFFFLVFGALHSDLFWFTGLIGLSISLNGGVCQSVAVAETAEWEVVEAT